jgi:hypothetical protein
MTTAEALRTFCEATPSVKVYQPLATSSVEVCLAAELE